MHDARCTFSYWTINNHGQPRNFEFRPFAVQRAAWYSAIPLFTLHVGIVHSHQGGQMAKSAWDEKWTGILILESNSKFVRFQDFL